MKILHTADWHLNDRLGRIDRTDDLRTAVERIAGLCQQHHVDVLLVAGDLFSELARADALRETIHHWQDTFADFLADGGTIVAITGNHDNETFCQTLRHAMALAAPTIGTPGEVVPTGRLHLAADPTFLKLPDRSGNFHVQFVLLPWPTPTHYLVGDRANKYSTPAEKNKLLVAAFDEAHAALRSHPNFDPSAPTVLSAHVHVFGALVGPALFRLDPAEDVVVDGSSFADRYAYVGLGHIHKPQAVNGKTHVRYSGSIEKLDLGEQADAKEVVLVDIGPTGRIGEPITVSIPSTPVREVTITDPPTDLPRLHAAYPDATRELVKLHVTYTAGTSILEDVLRELEVIFPRWYLRDWKEAGALGDPLTTADVDRSKTFADTVRDYLRAELIHHSDTDRDAILSLVDDLMDEEK